MLEINSQSIDAGIVTRNVDAMLTFYRDLLGLKTESVLDMPNGSTMYRLLAGKSLIKINVHDSPPERNGSPGGIRGATGLRYLTIHVSNLAEATEQIKAAGHKAVVDCLNLREGVDISIVEDPDGNYLELVKYS